MTAKTNYHHPKEARRPQVFVFGSNTGGIHGAGAARYALNKHGAIWGVGEGAAGSSYAIPTKGHIQLIGGARVGSTLPLITIQEHVNTFLAFAKAFPVLAFQVTRIGCGLAGLKDEWVAPMFADAPDNCYFDTVWKDFLPERDESQPPYRYWGTF